MGYIQGVTKLRQGVVRNLTPHEVKRGYIFISKNRALSKVLDVNDFEVEIAGRLYPSRKIDVSGRVHIPRTFLETIGAIQKLRIELVSRKRVTMTLWKSSS